MSRSSRFRVSITLAVALGLSAAYAQIAKLVDDRALQHASESSEWLTYGGDYAESHYSPLKQIDASNVSRLGLAWSSGRH